MSTLKTVNIQHPSSASVNAGTDSSGNFLINSGYGSVAAAYGCRAWVNFNGTGTVAIRASGNVTSITDNGTGDYTVNFTTAMPDANYCAIASSQISTNGTGNAGYFSAPSGTGTTPFATTGCRFWIKQGSTILDADLISVSVFR